MIKSSRLHLRRLIQTQYNLSWKYFEIKLNKSWTRLTNWFSQWIPNVCIIYVMLQMFLLDAVTFYDFLVEPFKNICIQDCIQEIVYLLKNLNYKSYMSYLSSWSLSLIVNTKIVSRNPFKYRTEFISMKLRKYRFLIISVAVWKVKKWITSLQNIKVK